MLKFTPKTEDEIAKDGLMPDGVYSFEVIGAEAKQSKLGNPMIVLTLRVFEDSGNTRQLTDYFLESVLYKVLHFCQFTGMIDQYQAGALNPDDMLGRTGFCKIGNEKAKEGFGPKNKILDYVKEKPASTPAKALVLSKSVRPERSTEAFPPTTDIDEDVPF